MLLNGVHKDTSPSHCAQSLEEAGILTSKYLGDILNELSEQQLSLVKRVNTCDMLQRHEKKSFLKRIIMRDETWISYTTMLAARDCGESAARLRKQ